jgi:hypothetical protein
MYPRSVLQLLYGNWPNPDGNAGQNGDGSWASATDFGSEKFFFVEDNCLKNITASLPKGFQDRGGNTDDLRGGRWVFRHNHCYDIEMQTHGTESGRYRGGRAREIYHNDFHNTHAHGTGGIRSGVTITHDNTYDGVQPAHGLVLEAYRAFFKWKSQSLPKGWGGATGIIPGMSTILKEMALMFRGIVRFCTLGGQSQADRILRLLMPLRTWHRTSGNILRQKGCVIIRSPLSNQTQITLLNYSITKIQEGELFGKQVTNIKSVGL